jgi:hypothetical protein
MSEPDLVVKLNAPTKFANNEIFAADAHVPTRGRARECLALVKAGHATPMMAAANLPSRVDGQRKDLNPGVIPGEPNSLASLKKRQKEALLKKAQELALTSTEPPPAGKSWFDVAAEQRWAKQVDRQEKDKAAEEAAHAELLNYWAAEAARQEAEAEAALARAKQFRVQAAKAAELVTYEKATHAVKIARDTFAVYEQLKDPRVDDARERLTVAEKDFAKADHARAIYEARIRLAQLQERLNAAGDAGSLFPKDRYSKANAANRTAQTALATGELADADAAMAELAEWLELPRENTPGMRPGITGFAG